MPTRQGATLQPGAKDLLVITVPSNWGASTMLILVIEASVKPGKLRTSTIASTHPDEPKTTDHEQIEAGILEGLGRHRSEILEGFGALGEYKQRDDLWGDRPREGILGSVRRA